MTVGPLDQLTFGHTDFIKSSKRSLYNITKVQRQVLLYKNNFVIVIAIAHDNGTHV